MSRISTRWFLGMAMGGALAFWANCAYAQSNIVPDNTLGAENSTVIPNYNGQPIEVISGGALRGQNLFHSLREFNVSVGRGAYFFSPGADIQNILARVTGSNRSQILGTLGTFGNSNPNLFLINPNGIIFGRNARLDVGGSFVATTANAIGFGNQGFFNATAPNNPSLLTVNPSAFFFNQIAAAPIQNNSIVPSGLNPSEDFIARGLRVPNGRSLLLVGGNINMNSGGLYAFGGRVELGGVSGAGTIGLNGDGNNLSLSFPNSVERSNVSLSNGAQVVVAAGGGGSITVNARNLELTGRSLLFTGIDTGLGSNNSKAGNIEVNATGAINLNNSFISNIVATEAKGQGGDISISASRLQVEGGAQVGAGTFGVGKGGNLTVDAQDVQVIGESADGRVASGLFATALSNSTGDAGDLTIKTNTLLVRDGAQVSAITFGSGKGGNLTVDAQNVQLISSALFASAESNSTGDAGDLTIKTNTLLVRDGAQVATGTFGSGNGGNLSVDAQDVQLIGRSADGRIGSGLFTSAQPNSTGDAGDLTIKTNTLLVRDGAQVDAGTFGSGKGGDLTVKTNTLLVRDGAQLTTSTSGSGKGGNLTVDAQNVQLIGISADDQSVSTLSASAQPNSTGNAGDLTIKTNTLLVQDGAVVSTTTFGSGKGGELSVDAQDVQLIGRSADGRSVSGLFASTDPNSTGDSGDLTIKTNTLLVRDGAQVSASTFGAGNGGNLTVDAQNVQLIGESADGQSVSGLFASAQPNSTGDAGDLTIKTNTLLVRDGAAVTVESFGTGTAGNMTVNARSIRLANNATLTANTRSTKVEPNRQQATININSRNLIMRGGSNIRTNATGENVIGGNININTDFLVAVENSDISANSANFRGGNVRINAQGIFGTQFRDVASDKTSDITATGASRELNGIVELNTPDFDPNSGFFNLPAVPVDTELAQGCTAGGNQARSQFTVTGRGGLPLNPREAFNNNDTVRVDWVTLNPTSNNRSTPTVTNKSTAIASPPIVEATGWMLNQKGEVVLTANALTTTPHSPWFNPASCTTSKS